jgi:hypothetical protein
LYEKGDEITRFDGTFIIDAGVFITTLLHRMGKDQELPKAHVYRIHFHTKACICMKMYEIDMGFSVTLDFSPSCVTVLRILFRIHRIHVFWASWIHQSEVWIWIRIRVLLSLSKNSKKNLDFYCFATSY